MTVEAEFLPSRPAGDIALAPILAAARRCYAQGGVESTRMEDVARAAGISRQYLYRFVPGRAGAGTVVIRIMRRRNVGIPAAP